MPGQRRQSQKDASKCSRRWTLAKSNPVVRHHLLNLTSIINGGRMLISRRCDLTVSHVKTHVTDEGISVS